MGIFNSKQRITEASANFNPRNMLEELLKATSGADVPRNVSYSIYYKIVGFKPVKEGVGCSTLVSCTALALAKLGLSVCVLDTSILNPSQDTLLNTGNISKEDWLELPFTNSNVLSVSKRNSKVHVLSFRHRTVLDLVSTSENEDLATVAFTQLLNKYDILLVDLSNEPSAVSTTCMQMCHKVIQVWNNSPHILSNTSAFIESNVVCCCPLDKMSTVVTSMVIDDIKTDWDTILNQYKFRRIANMPMSLDVARILAMGRLPFNYVSKSEGVELYNKFILSIVSDIVELETEPELFSGKLPDADATETDSSVSTSKNDCLNDEVLVDDVEVISDSVSDDYDYEIIGEDSIDIEDIEE